jgi:hypothetical protein
MSDILIKNNEKFMLIVENLIQFHGATGTKFIDLVLSAKRLSKQQKNDLLCLYGVTLRILKSKTKSGDRKRYQHLVDKLSMDIGLNLKLTFIKTMKGLFLFSMATIVLLFLLGLGEAIKPVLMLHAVLVPISCVLMIFYYLIKMTYKALKAPNSGVLKAIFFNFFRTFELRYPGGSYSQYELNLHKRC